MHCRHQLKHRKRPVGGKKVIIPDKVSIDERPATVNEKRRFRDWEVDTIVGPGNNGAILTLTERVTGFLLMKKLPKGKKRQSACTKPVLYAFTLQTICPLNHFGQRN